MKQKFFTLARIASLSSTHHSHRLGCVIVNKNRIISFGWNQMKTHTQSVHSFKFLHAEIYSLLGVDFEKTNGCVAYVYREDKNGNPALSKPCDACQLALRKSGIKKVYFTTAGGWDEMFID